MCYRIGNTPCPVVLQYVNLQFIKISCIMLRLQSIEKAKGDNFTKQKLVVLRFSKCESKLLGASFATSTYSITAHLEQMTEIVKDQNDNEDLETSLANAIKEFVGTEEKNAYGFDVAISEFFPNATHFVAGEQKIATRSIMGIASSEEAARIEALQREKARLDYAVAKGTIEVVYKND